jgi:rubrerythrin
VTKRYIVCFLIVLTKMKAEERVKPVYWRCTYCGYGWVGVDAPDECPQCFAGKDEFTEED